MIRRRRVPDDVGEQSGPSALSSISDLMTGLMLLFIVMALHATDGLDRARTSSTPSSQEGFEPHPAPAAQARGGDQLWGLGFAEFEQRQLRTRVREASKYLHAAPRWGAVFIVVGNAPDLRDLDTWPARIDRATGWLSTVLTHDLQRTKGSAGCELGLLPRGVTVRAFGPRSSRTVVVDAGDKLQDAVERTLQSSQLKDRTVDATYALAGRERIELMVSFQLDPARRELLTRRFSDGPAEGQDSEQVVCR